MDNYGTLLNPWQLYYYPADTTPDYEAILQFCPPDYEAILHVK